MNNPSKNPLSWQAFYPDCSLSPSWEHDNFPTLLTVAPASMTQIVMDSIEGFILAGGASRRMGTDKARLVLAGQTFLERIAGEILAVVSTVTIVSREGQNDSIDLNGHPLRVVKDLFQEWGALGGLHAALATARTEWALVVACDLPLVTRDLFLHLASLRGDNEAVAPIQADGRPQPLCAIYRTAICHPVIEKLIKGGERRPRTLLQSVRTRWVTFAELADLKGASLFFENLNTPEDYARALRKEARLI